MSTKNDIMKLHLLLVYICKKYNINVDNYIKLDISPLNNKKTIKEHKNAVNILMMCVWNDVNDSNIKDFSNLKLD